MTNYLYYGDNLQILRDHIKDESVDLIYLDPPFNSKATYNVLFRSQKGHQPHAQIAAFEDTWHWGEQAEKEFNEIVYQPNTDVSEMMQSLRKFLGENDMMAYLTMMANRLLELHHVLKQSGSLYLHCDPTASHYLKIVLDGVFGKENFGNEIIWQRTNVHSDSKTWSKVSDTIFFYTKTDNFIWNAPYLPHSEAHVASKYSNVDEQGRRYTLSDMTSPAPRPNMMYEWKGFPYPPNGWRYSKETMAKLDAEGRIWYPADRTKRPRLKRFLEDMPGTLIGNIWTDIPPINSQAQERLGYPTQKPLPLLERIIAASSNEGDVVLDPFCGCGTAVHAAEKLRRKWIGIDLTHLAISLVEKRLRDAFPGIMFEVHGTPKDFEGARDLAQRDKYQFQWWACSLVNAQPFQGKKRGADTGIDGVIYFQDDQSAIQKHKSLPKKIIVSVKGGENVSVPMIRDLGHVIDREDAAIGLFITLAKPTRPMKEEAIKAGYYQSPTGADFPKIQILTIEGLLNGTERPRFPDLMRGGLMFKKAEKEAKEKQVPLPAFARPTKAVQSRLPGRAFSDSPLLDELEADSED